MSPLEVLQLIGYSIGVVLPLWMVAQLSRRRWLTAVERVLFALSVSIGAWHASNLLITVHHLLGFGYDRWTTLLRLADSIAVISITFTYSLLLHLHLHLWANSSGRPLTRNERLRVYLSYLPTVFLLVSVPRIWTGNYAPMFAKLSFFVLPFAFWIAYVLALIAVTEWLIARRSQSASERKVMRTLAASFVAVGIIILAALALGVGEGTRVGLYLKTIANLGSLLPSVLLAYYIYRYRYLELIIEESLIVATFAAVVLVIYIYVIRTIGDWLTTRYRIKVGVVEALLILGLTLVAAPFRRWLAARFHQLFERETALYRQIVSRIGANTDHKQLPDLLHFVEEKTAQSLALRRVKIAVSPAVDSFRQNDNHGQSGVDHERWVDDILKISQLQSWAPIENEPELLAHGFNLAYPLRREGRVAGALLIEGSSASLMPDTRAVLNVLADQVAIAIEDWRLVEENVRLERRLAEQDRLAVLGQMAATVAHEVKNPLSAIKNIAQVMREDEALSSEYVRDLSVIVGETDRLNQSVAQLLSFARKQTTPERAMRVEELMTSVVNLLQPGAAERRIELEYQVESNDELSGAVVSAVRDSVSNLVLNAVQATDIGGKVSVLARREGDQLLLIVRDSGAGVPAELQERIWEPFFTTKQRGTGLGLAIVRKRMQETGGTARLATATNGEGAVFELRVPLSVTVRNAV